MSKQKCNDFKDILVVIICCLFYFSSEIPWQIKMWAPVILLVIVFHMLDRKNELAARTDFLWRAKLKVEQEEVETMRGINKILLENILPAHVAEHFLQEQVLQVSEKKSKRFI